MADGQHYTEQWVQKTEAPAGIVENGLQAGLATRLYLGCMQILKSICGDFTQTVPEENSAQAQVDLLKPELGKFFLWGESRCDGSLDDAIDEMDAVKCMVLRLLCDIAEELFAFTTSQRSSDLVEDFARKRGIIVEPLLVEAREVIDSLKVEVHDPSGDVDDDVSAFSDESATSQDSKHGQIHGLATRIAPYIHDLMELGPTIQNNLEQRAIKAESNDYVNDTFSVHSSAQHYVSMIRDKFPEASLGLIERLGEANWQRHVIIRNHATNKSSGLTTAIGTTDKRTIFSQYGKVSLFHDSGIGTSDPKTNENAASTYSHTSFVSTMAEDGHRGPSVPPTPKAVRHGKAFECNICYRQKWSIRNRIDWKMHVYADLKPYMCTHAECGEEMILFATREAWAQHEFDEHRIQFMWQCNTCPEELSTPELWRDHLRRIHKSTFSRLQLETVVAGALRCRYAPISEELCPLCQHSAGGTRRQFTKHMCRHMEEIALATLPRDLEGDDEGSEAETDSSGRSVARNQSIPTQDQMTDGIAPDDWYYEVICCPPDMNLSFKLGHILRKDWDVRRGATVLVVDATKEADAFADFMTPWHNVIRVGMQLLHPYPQLLGTKVLARYRASTTFYHGVVREVTPTGYQISFKPGDGESFVDARYVVEETFFPDEWRIIAESSAPDYDQLVKSFWMPSFAQHDDLPTCTAPSVSSAASCTTPEREPSPAIPEPLWDVGSFPKSRQEGSHQVRHRPVVPKRLFEIEAKKSEQAAAAHSETKKAAAVVETSKGPPDSIEDLQPIRFKDVLGRKFSFPFKFCCTWAGMALLIEQSFQLVDKFEHDVQMGHYDLIGPQGAIIMPSTWETVIKPGWSITMHMWPMNYARAESARSASLPQADKTARPKDIAGYPCRYAWCGRDQKPFKRKDHLLEHLRTVHMLRRSGRSSRNQNPASKEGNEPEAED